MLDYINPPLISFRRDPDEAVLPGYIKPPSLLPTDINFIKTEGEDVYITAVKREENGGDLLMRIVSFARKKQKISVSVNSMINCKKSWRYNFKEIKEEQISEGSTAIFEIMPKQIITVGYEIN